jgi:transitional endoplasmic reticulum ATPase
MVNFSPVQAKTATLCPAQQEAFSNLMEALPIGNVFVVWSGAGMGRTTMLEELHRVKGGEFLKMKDYIDELRVQNPLAMDEALEQILMRPLHRNDLVILDDLDLVYDVICGCGYNSPYPRAKYVEAILTSVVDYAVAHDKKIVFGNRGGASAPISNQCYYAGFQRFEASDYEFVCHAYLEEKAKNLDYKKIHRFAPKLNAHQLKVASVWLRNSEALDTEKFIEYLRKRKMTSNVDLEEVEAVELHSLKGLDDLIESLEANIIVPLERDELANEFNIQPKRGVLLAGPPGTGKTTVGRALAHRLRSKFFLIDGTFISGSRDFYQKVERVFEAAKNNAPSIIFIDDSDVIFENKDDFGLYRYLLTALDGLESESNRRVCIMMTTMDVSSVPAALVRSGRIELWLETSLPDEKARLEILSDHAKNLPEQLRGVDVGQLASKTDGLTGADLRRLIEDGKILYAYDKSRNREAGDLLGYFQKAIETIRSNKEKYAEAEAKSKSKAATSDPFAFMRQYRGYSDGDDDDSPA